MKPRHNLYQDSLFSFLDVYHSKEGKPRASHIFEKDNTLKKFGSSILVPLIIPLNIYTISEMIEPPGETQHQERLFRVIMSATSLVLISLNMAVTFKSEAYSTHLAPIVASVATLGLLIVLPKDCVDSVTGACETVIKINICSYMLSQAVIASLLSAKTCHLAFIVLQNIALLVTALSIRTQSEVYENSLPATTIISIIIVVSSFLVTSIGLLSVKMSLKTHFLHLIEVASFSTSQYQKINKVIANIPMMAGALILTEKIDQRKTTSPQKYEQPQTQKQRFKLTFATPGFAANINQMTDAHVPFSKSSGYQELKRVLKTTTLEHIEGKTDRDISADQQNQIIASTNIPNFKKQSTEFSNRKKVSSFWEILQNFVDQGNYEQSEHFFKINKVSTKMSPKRKPTEINQSKSFAQKTTPTSSKVKKGRHHHSQLGCYDQAVQREGFRIFADTMDQSSIQKSLFDISLTKLNREQHNNSLLQKSLSPQRNMQPQLIPDYAGDTMRQEEQQEEKFSITEAASCYISISQQRVQGADGEWQRVIAVKRLEETMLPFNLVNITGHDVSKRVETENRTRAKGENSGTRTLTPTNRGSRQEISASRLFSSMPKNIMPTQVNLDYRDKSLLKLVTLQLKEHKLYFQQIINTVEGLIFSKQVNQSSNQTRQLESSLDITYKSHAALNPPKRVTESEIEQLQHILNNAKFSQQRVSTLNSCIKVIHTDHKHPNFELGYQQNPDKIIREQIELTQINSTQEVSIQMNHQSTIRASVLELDWKRFTQTIGALMMAAVKDQKYIDKIIIEMKIQSGNEEPIERVPMFQKPQSQERRSSNRKIMYFATTIFENSPQRARAISSHRSELRDIQFDNNILLAEVLAVSMGGIVQSSTTGDYRIMKLLLPVNGKVVYNNLKHNGFIEQNLTDSLMKLQFAVSNNFQVMHLQGTGGVIQEVIEENRKESEPVNLQGGQGSNTNKKDSGDKYSKIENQHQSSSLEKNESLNQEKQKNANLNGSRHALFTDRIPYLKQTLDIHKRDQPILTSQNKDEIKTLLTTSQNNDLIIASRNSLSKGTEKSKNSKQFQQDLQNDNILVSPQVLNAPERRPYKGISAKDKEVLSIKQPIQRISTNKMPSSGESIKAEQSGKFGQSQNICRNSSGLQFQKSSKSKSTPKVSNNSKPVATSQTGESYYQVVSEFDSGNLANNDYNHDNYNFESNYSQAANNPLLFNKGKEKTQQPQKIQAKGIQNQQVLLTNKKKLNSQTSQQRSEQVIRQNKEEKKRPSSNIYKSDDDQESKKEDFSQHAQAFRIARGKSEVQNKQNDKDRINMLVDQSEGKKKNKNKNQIQRVDTIEEDSKEGQRSDQQSVHRSGAIANRIIDQLDGSLIIVNDEIPEHPSEYSSRNLSGLVKNSLVEKSGFKSPQSQDRLHQTEQWQEMKSYGKKILDNYDEENQNLGQSKSQNYIKHMQQQHQDGSPQQSQQRSNIIEKIKNDFPAKLELITSKQNSESKKGSAIASKSKSQVRQDQLQVAAPGSLKSQLSMCSCKATVLVVEDNQYNVMPVEMILKHNYGIEIDIATDGKSAVKMVKKSFTKACCNIRYKMVFMDLLMPVMQGYEATKLINDFLRTLPKQQNQGAENASQSSQGPRLPVFAMTSFVNNDTVIKCQNHGMSGILYKPVSREGLMKQVDKFYVNKGSFSQGKSPSKQN